MGRIEEAAGTRTAAAAERAAGGPARPGHHRAGARSAGTLRLDPSLPVGTGRWCSEVAGPQVPRERGATAGGGLGGAGLLLAANAPGSPRRGQPAGSPSWPRGVTRNHESQKATQESTSSHLGRPATRRGAWEAERQDVTREDAAGGLRGPRAPASSAPAPSCQAHAVLPAASGAGQPARCGRACRAGEFGDTNEEPRKTPTPFFQKRIQAQRKTQEGRILRNAHERERDVCASARLCGLARGEETNTTNSGISDDPRRRKAMEPGPEGGERGSLRALKGARRVRLLPNTGSGLSKRNSRNNSSDANI